MIKKKGVTIGTRDLKSLRRDLQKRRFAVPKLQRNFVWDAGRAALLLDSIYRQMPIGSLFLWEMDRKSAHLIRQASGVLPAFDTHNKRVWFVIDGQQRLSVLAQAFEGGTRENDAGRAIDFGRLSFVVRPDNSQGLPARIVYRKPQVKELVPLRDILAADWKSRMPSKAKWFLKRIRDCRARLLNYPVPVVTVVGASLEEIGEVFIRVNSQGMRITSADRAIALMGKLDVRAMAEELRSRVRDQVFALKAIDPILMGFNLATERPELDGDPPKLDALARSWSKRIEDDENEKAHFRRLWHRYQEAFLAAVDYLHHRFPVYDDTYLPSANMLATLSVFFFHHRGQPNSKQATEIRKWFWATGVAQRYSGRGYHRNLVADSRFFEQLADGKSRRFVFRDYLDPVLDIQSSEYSSSSARSRAFFCLLASRNPRYLDGGEPIPLGGGVASHANRRQRHHIYPRGRMKQYVASRVYNGLCNICFLVARDNAGIGMKLPASYLAEFHSKNRRQFGTIMKSHLIPATAGSAVWTRGAVSSFTRFRKQRLALICREFEKAAGTKLFRAVR